MGIKKVILNDEEVFKVSYHKRSRKDRSVRAQRGPTFVSCEVEANKLLQEFKEDCCYRVGVLEAQGETWEGLIDRWNQFYIDHPSKKMSQTTRHEYYGILRKWSKDWFQRSAKDILVGDCERLLFKAFKAGASLDRRQTIKSVIHVVFKWAIGRRLIKEIDVSPMFGLEVIPYEGEVVGEKMPLIKTKDEISEFLNVAKEKSHPWYPIWFFDLHTGMRAQELNALRKDKIELIDEKNARSLCNLLDQGKLSMREAHFGNIFVHSSWKPAMKKNSSTKNHHWRTVPVSRDLYWFLVDYLPKADWGSDEYGERVFQNFKSWDRGEQAREIKLFCAQHNFGEATFHMLRAIWATQMLIAGVDHTTVMKVGGWADLRTMMIYIRRAGVDVKGATNGLSFTAKKAVESPKLENVVQLFGQS